MFEFKWQSEYRAERLAYCLFAIFAPINSNIRLMDGTTAFWTRAYRRHIGRIIGICYRYVPDRNTAEDLAHDAFLKAIENADTFRGTGRFGSWLTRITVNIALHYLRDNHMEALKNRLADTEEIPTDKEEALDEEGGNDKMMEEIRKADFSQQEILEAIAQLPENQRIVLNLYVFEGYSHKQIAELRGISVNTSKSHLLRARKELKHILFDKSKKKNRPLMTWFLPIPLAGNVLDRYCRRQMRGFTMEPQHPLTVGNIPATYSLPVRLRLHALRLPAMASIGTAAVGAILLPSLLQQPAPHAQQLPEASPFVADTAAVADLQNATIEMEEPIVSVPPPARDTLTAAHRTGTPTQSETVETPCDTAPQTVVVKKVRRKSNKTIIIHESKKHE